MRIMALTAGIVALTGCGLFGGNDERDEPEGRNAGECSDAADNDGDGLFDCDDDDCTGSPDCEDDDDVVSDDDDDIEADRDFDLSFDPPSINVLLPLGYTTEVFVEVTNDGDAVVIDDIRVTEQSGGAVVRAFGSFPWELEAGERGTFELGVAVPESPDITTATLRVETDLGVDTLDVYVESEVD